MGKTHLSNAMIPRRVPRLVVFDLDGCAWDPEMFELPAPPSTPIRQDLGYGPQIAGLQAGSATVKLHTGCLVALRELHANPAFANTKVAVASSSLVPEYSVACMDGLEVLPGLPMAAVFDYTQIGRTGKLTSRKTTHFRELIEESGIPYSEMLFFDDCSCESIDECVV